MCGALKPKKLVTGVSGVGAIAQLTTLPLPLPLPLPPVQASGVKKESEAKSEEEDESADSFARSLYAVAQQLDLSSSPLTSNVEGMVQCCGVIREGNSRERYKEVSFEF
jgi:hypothetical protein